MLKETSRSIVRLNWTCVRGREMVVARQTDQNVRLIQRSVAFDSDRVDGELWSNTNGWCSAEMSKRSLLTFG